MKLPSKNLLFAALTILLPFGATAQTPTCMWGKIFTGPANSADVTTHNGSIYVAGTFSDNTIDFGGITLNRSSQSAPIGQYADAFVAKFTDSGQVVWAKKSDGADNVADVKVMTSDAQGNIIVAGTYKIAPISFDNITLSSPLGLYNNYLFIVKYDSSGNVLWAKQSAGDGGQYISDITTDGNGNIYLTGTFESPTITFGTVTLNNTSNANPLGGNADNIFVAKFNASGTIVWAENPTGDGTNNYCFGIATDMAGNVYLTGSFVGNYLNFNNASITAPIPDGNPLFVAKMDTNGNQIWGKAFGSVGDAGRNILVDPAGAVYITGSFSDATFSFGNVSLTNLGSNDIFLAKMDTAGNVLWAKSAGGNNIDIVDDLSADDSGNVYLAGMYISPSISFGTLTLNNNNNGINEYLAKYNSLGEAKWLKNIFVDSVNNGAIGINVPAIGIGQGNVYMVSRFNLPSITLDTITLADAAYPNYYSSFFAKFGIPQSGGGNDTNNLITEKRFNPDLKIFPNPSSDGEITLTSPLFNGQPVAITIFDIKGKLVEDATFSGKTKVRNALNLKLHLAPGVYFLTLKMKEGSVTKKIILRE